jgi:hypothetical protein
MCGRAQSKTTLIVMPGFARTGLHQMRRAELSFQGDAAIRYRDGAPRMHQE